MRLIDADALLQRAVPHGWSTPLWVSDIVIEDAPTIEAEPDREWIPVTERLPEANSRFLVTRGLVAAGALWNRVYIANYSDLMGIKSEKIWWQGNFGKSDFERLDDVVSWMPLPEPWKGGAE